MARINEFQQIAAENRTDRGNGRPRRPAMTIRAGGRSVSRILQPKANRFDPAKQQHTGAVLGIAMASFRTSQGED